MFTALKIKKGSESKVYTSLTLTPPS